MLKRIGPMLFTLCLLPAALSAAGISGAEVDAGEVRSDKAHAQGLSREAVQSDAEHPELEQMLRTARSNITLIDMATFRGIMKVPGDALVIDVREPNEFQSGYIPGAVNIPRGMLEFRIWKYVGYPERLDKGRRIYLYCKQGQRSTLAGYALSQLGFSQVTAVDMKITEWEQAGYPFEF